MEIINSRQGLQQVAGQAARVAEAGLTKKGVETKTVAAKAAPEVAEFEKVDLDKAIKELQDFVDDLGRSLTFRRDESIDRNVITVMDTQTDQVVRQIPSEEVVAMSRQIREEMAEMRAGLLVNKNV